MEIPFRKDDQAAVMANLGPMLPVLLREGLDEGFYRFKKSRSFDPDGFVDYGPCAKANMLYDRIASPCRDLIGLAAMNDSALSWKITSNKRATDIMYDPYFSFRIKRVKQNRGGRSTGVRTRRQRSIKSTEILPVDQMVLDFPGMTIQLPDENRVWITLAFDLDDLEESLERVALGIEGEKYFLWKRPLPEADADIIASFPTVVADRINEMRVLRSA